MMYLGIILGIVFFDQATKQFMSEWLALCVPGQCESFVVLPVFQFTLLHNTGAAFSFLHDAGGWQRWFLVVVSSGVSVFIAQWLYRIRHDEKLLSIALALILGGAIGNLIDRAFVGYVVDFIVVHWDHHYFPAFNVADSAISVGAAVMILDMFIKPSHQEQVHE